MTLLDTYIHQIATIEPKGIFGQVESIRGLTVRVSNFPAPVDSAVEIEGGTGRVTGQVVGFEGSHAVVMALGRLEGVSSGDRVGLKTGQQRIICSPMLVGRVIDAMGRPMDGKGPIKLAEPRAVNVRSVDCMRRIPIDKPVGTGIRS